MREITMRDFLRTPKSFLPPPSEGLMITRRDGENFYLYPNVRQDVRQTSTIPVENNVMAFCDLNKAHPFMKGVEFEVRQITWEDENGNPLIKGWGCEKCISYLENLGRGKVYFL